MKCYVFWLCEIVNNPLVLWMLKSLRLFPLLARKIAPVGLLALRFLTQFLHLAGRVAPTSSAPCFTALLPLSLLGSKTHLLDPKDAPDGLGSLRAAPLRSERVTHFRVFVLQRLTYPLTQFLTIRRTFLMPKRTSRAASLTGMVAS